MNIWVVDITKTIDPSKISEKLRPTSTWYRYSYRASLTQNDRHVADDISTCIFRNENVWIL